MRISRVLVEFARLLLNDDVEWCGFLFGEKSDLDMYIKNYGQDLDGRAACSLGQSYRPIIWHTHPNSVKSYPSGEDYLKILKTGTNRPVISLIFTRWGIWELYAKKKLNLSDIPRLLKEITELSKPIYEQSERGMSRNPPKNIYAYAEYMEKYLSMNIHFTPWNESEYTFYTE